MTSKYTNGPWIAKGENGRYNNSRNSWSVYDDAPLNSEVAPITLADGTVIAFAVASSDDYIFDDRVDDIARLIAAAPDLLEALMNASGVLQAYSAQSKTAEICEQMARAAIAKATGH